MELLNVGFAILLIKVTISFMPGVIGIYCIVSPEESKRKLRGWLCSRLFGISNAIEYQKLSRLLVPVGVIAILVSAIFTWFLLIGPMLPDSAN